ncbi:hypothetical protein GCM10010106_00580 [Thermopolyspora flexuosa]|nr:hypothetical protein GCM10010106_00580 [Thermopolyspora flexuosa]
MTIHSVNPAAVTSGPATISRRRENVSAHTPLGSSAANAVSDHTANSEEISAGDSPVLVNSTVYTG